MKSAVIFGGTGFIGVFFSQFLLAHGHAEKVYLIDTQPIELKFSQFRKLQVTQDVRIDCLVGDVRKPLDWLNISEPVTLVANFAAIHREPGHEDYEYFETNLLGAENVCKFAERVGCQNIIFTSSISPYGVSESVKYESTLPVPVTAYGSSKLVA